MKLNPFTYYWTHRDGLFVKSRYTGLGCVLLSPCARTRSLRLKGLYTRVRYSWINSMFLIEVLLTQQYTVPSVHAGLTSSSRRCLHEIETHLTRQYAIELFRVGLTSPSRRTLHEIEIHLTRQCAVVPVHAGSISPSQCLNILALTKTRGISTSCTAILTWSRSRRVRMSSFSSRSETVPYPLQSESRTSRSSTLVLVQRSAFSSLRESLSETETPMHIRFSAIALVSVGVTSSSPAWVTRFPPCQETLKYPPSASRFDLDRVPVLWTVSLPRSPPWATERSAPRDARGCTSETQVSRRAPSWKSGPSWAKSMSHQKQQEVWTRWDSIVTQVSVDYSQRFESKWPQYFTSCWMPYPWTLEQTMCHVRLRCNISNQYTRQHVSQTSNYVS